MTAEAEGSGSVTDSHDQGLADRRAAPVRMAQAAQMNSRVAATLSTVEAIGLTCGKKERRFSGRAHEELFAAAAARSGLKGNDLLEYALAKVALEDDFAERLLAREGTVTRDVDFGI